MTRPNLLTKYVGSDYRIVYYAEDPAYPYVIGVEEKDNDLIGDIRWVVTEDIDALKKVLSLLLVVENE